MTTNSPIEWTDHTFNPWWGCTKVSQGCKHCYAETLAKRTGRDVWGPQAQRRRTSAANWREPFKWNKAARADGTIARVFCASMADIFEDNEQVIPWRKELWEVVAQTPSLTWQLLTKRPENIGRMVPLHWSRGEWPSNVWIGTSIEDQATADERIYHLLKAPARVRFLSIEPLLGPVDLTCVRAGDYVLDVLDGRYGTGVAATPFCFGMSSLRAINWVIVGGESGPHARPMHPAWVRSLRDQCQAARTAFFFKQWGEWALKGAAPGANASDFSVLAPDGTWYHQHTGWNGRPIDPDTGEAYMLKVGKKAAGRLLDGAEWNQLPLATLRTVQSVEVTQP